MKSTTLSSNLLKFPPSPPSQGHVLVARRIVDQIELLVRDFILPRGFNIIVVGHSLGGSLACTVAMILRSRLVRTYPKILTDGGDIVKVVAIASPPCVNEETAMVSKPFITTVVNNSDVIPRWSLDNLALTVVMLKLVTLKMYEHGGRRKFVKIMLSKKPIMTQEEMEAGLDVALSETKEGGTDHMCVAGEVVVMYDLWSKPDYTLADKKKGAEKAQIAEGILLCDGMAKVLRYIEVDFPWMGLDHMTT